MYPPIAKKRKTDFHVHKERYLKKCFDRVWLIMI